VLDFQQLWIDNSRIIEPERVSVKV